MGEGVGKEDYECMGFMSLSKDMNMQAVAIRLSLGFHNQASSHLKDMNLACLL